MREGSPPLTFHVSRVTCQVSGVTCHVSRVMCHMSRVTCHMSFFSFFSFIIYIFFCGQIGGASQWRVCYQRGLARLVYFISRLFAHSV